MVSLLLERDQTNSKDESPGVLTSGQMVVLIVLRSGVKSSKAMR